MVFAVACVVRGADPDAAIVTAMHSAAGVDHVQVLRRTRVDADMDLVIATGSLRTPPVTYGQQRWYWGEETPLGVFLQRPERPDMVYRLAVDKGQRDIDCSARLERVTSTEVVISCTPEKGRFGPMRKFVYDSRAKALVKQFDYSPYEMARIFASGERAVLVGTNYQELAAVEYDPARTPAFRILRGAEETAWTRRVPTTTGTVGLEMRREIYIGPESFEEVRFGGGRGFTLMKGGLVTEKTARGAIRFPLPQSTYDEFAKARPGRVRDGYRRPGTIIDERIGPSQIEGDRLWFGKTFYDGEGNTGIGGFGYFDAVEKKYRIYSPPEIAGWSVSAILAEPDTIWLGIADNGEYGTSAGGMLAFNRRTQQIRKFELPDVAQGIARVGEHLVLATQSGPAVLDSEGVRRFFVDETSNGRLYVAEATAVSGPAQQDNRPGK
jgi:hypothetical protein